MNQNQPSDQHDSFTGGARRGTISAREFYQLHEIFAAIVQKQIEGAVLLPETVREELNLKDSAPADEPIPEPLPDWLALLDLAVSPHLLRSYIQDGEVGEDALRALLRFFVMKKVHFQVDRDKVDWLATHFFRVREEERKSPTGWPRSEVSEILQGLDFMPLSRYSEELLMEMTALVEEVNYLQNFRQITDSRIIERARDLKNQLGEEFFHPDILAAVVHYNLVFGKKFHALLREILQEVGELIAQAEGDAIDPDQLLRKNYRSTASAFRQLSEMGEKKEAKKGVPKVESAPSRAAEERPVDLSELGIDPARQAERLRNRMKEISMRLKANPGLASIPSSLEPLLLSEWEANAFQTDFRESEQSFRAEFTRGICLAIGIQARIYDELALYCEMRPGEYNRKPHADALVYLLHEGRRHKKALMQLAGDSLKRGLSEKSNQLASTAEKLEGCLQKMTALFDAPALPD